MSKNEKIALAVAVAVFILWRASIARAESDPAVQIFDPYGGDFGGHGATGSW